MNILDSFSHYLLSFPGSCVTSQVNCLTEIFFDAALERARELDAHLAAGNPPVGPLHGLPVSLKENFKIKGESAACDLGC